MSIYICSIFDTKIKRKKKMSNTLQMNKIEINQFNKKIKKYTQQSLADYCGVSRSYIGHILSGRRRCPDRILKKIKKYLKA